ncbi:hypothetical protein KAR91_46215, partial [Candidatus Pacearchaeota archaeon]|nr:hypothetical protein [Candidatus Pacearchaeota archaeon]
TGLTQQNTRTFLKLLERDQMINKQTTSKLTKITILKYDSYQLNQQAEEAETNNQTTNDQQTSNNPVTTDKKEEKEENNKKEKKVSIPPEFQDVVNYCNERNKGVNPQKWFDHYQAKGWLIGKTKMKDWEAAVRTWEKDTNEPISELAQIKKEIKDGTFK